MIFYQQGLTSLNSLPYYLIIKCTEQYNNLFKAMEFTHINKCQTSLSKHHKPTSDTRTIFKYDTSSTSRSNLSEILTNIDQITMARSFQLNKINQPENSVVSCKTNANIYPKQPILLDAPSKITQIQQGVRPIQQRKSLIYSEHNSNKCSVHESLMGLQVKIFYFNLPTYKVINYDQNTTISDIIQEALDAYIADRQLDSNKIQDRYFKSKINNYLDYQMRLLLDQQRHQADMTVPSLSYDRLLIDNLIDALVIVETKQFKQKKHKFGMNQYVKTPIKLASSKQQYLNIFLLNEFDEQLVQIKAKREDSLQTVYQIIQQNDLHQMKTFNLTQNKNDDYFLPKDFELKHLQSNKLYIKVKRFIDQSEPQTEKIKEKNSFIKSKTYDEAFNMPISLKEASQYQQFTVVKINKFGFQQQRILGIDQDKIYNYSKQMKEQKKQPNFFKKFFGINETTGTKRPFRLIKDIVKIHNTQKGFNLTYHDKTIVFQLKDSHMKHQIIRKLEYLIKYSSNQQKLQKQLIKK